VGDPALFFVGSAIEFSTRHELEQGKCVIGNDESTVLGQYRCSGDQAGFGEASSNVTASRQLRQVGGCHPLCDVGSASVGDQPSLGVHTAPERSDVGSHEPPVSVEQIGYVGDHYESLSLVGQLIFFWVGTRITAVANSFRSPIPNRRDRDLGRRLSRNTVPRHRRAFRLRDVDVCRNQLAAESG